MRRLLERITVALETLARNSDQAMRDHDAMQVKMLEALEELRKSAQAPVYYLNMKEEEAK